MATIKQIVSFMNENKIKWHPQDVVEVVYSQVVVKGYEGYQTGILKSDPDTIYIKIDCQRFIDHYYVENNNMMEGVMLLPLSTGKYLKVNFNVAV